MGKLYKDYLSTSPPLSPSPSKERGRNIKKRGFAPLRLPLLWSNNGGVLERLYPSKKIIFPFPLIRGRGYRG